MAISRMQQPRQNYGLGSFVKKAVGKVTKPFTKVAKKLVPKEIAGIMRVAAPFLPPGFREASYLLGTAKQTGRISPVDLALAAAPTFFSKTNMGRGIAQKVGNYTLPGMETNLKELAVGRSGEFGFEGPSKGFFGESGKIFNFGKGAGFTDFKDQTKLGSLLLGDKKTGGFSKSKIAGLGVGILSLIQSAKTPDEAGNLLVAQTGNSDDYQRGFDLFSQIDTSSFEIPDQFRLNSANGGLMRTNYAMGSDDEPKPLPNDPTEPVNPFGPKPIGPFPSKMAGIPKDLDLEKAKEMFIEFNGREPIDMQELLEFFNVKQQAAGGGLMRENFALGTRPTEQESGLGGLPIEADMRYTGGFMPYGEVEKADDVPARLSKNEFVFTADAVRAAGGGSVQQGAKKMYDTMKKLEQQPEAKGAIA
tara:strand:+ start:3020 stop:4273 length:1254 start_codon:yes stop_codon:yes gene_type:complete